MLLIVNVKNELTKSHYTSLNFRIVVNRSYNVAVQRNQSTEY